MALSVKTYNKLYELLSNNPAIEHEDRRRSLLLRAEFDDALRAQIKTTGASFSFLGNLVDILTQYGAMSNGQDAFVAFLEATKEIVGKDKQEVLDEIINEWAEQKTKLTWPASVQAYFDYLIRKWEQIESPLLPQNFNFSEIAAPLKIIHTVTQEQLASESANKMSRSLIDDRWDLSDIIKAYPDINKWAILGDPGTGKTTLLIAEAARLARNAKVEATGYLPVLISLAEFGKFSESRQGASLYQFIDSIGNLILADDFGRTIQTFIRKGQVIFLFDGLDEVSDSFKQNFRELANAVLALDGKNKMIVTSRKIGFTGLAGFSVLEIAPLGINDQRKIMLAICGTEKTQRLLAEISGRVELQQMAGVPMMLTVLSLVAREAKDFSSEYFHRYSHLFKFASMMLLQGRHRRNVGVKSAYNAEQILADVSLILHGYAPEMKVDEVFDLDQIEESVRQSDANLLRPWNDPRDFIEDVTKCSNIIYPIGNLSQRYKYIHRTFREYFAALRLSKLPSNDRKQFVESVLHTQTWSEVLVILGGLVPDTNQYLVSLLNGPPDLALRALKEVDHLKPELAAEILQLESTNFQSRKQVFVELVSKLESVSAIVDVLWAYMKSVKGEIPRVDLYFIQEVLNFCGSDLADKLSQELFSFLPEVSDNILEESLFNKNETYWKKVPAGKFLFGAAENDPGRPDWVCTYRDVFLSEYNIGKYPVVNKLYEFFDPSHRNKRSFVNEVPGSELDYHPVVQVSWYEAEMFCQWLATKIPGVRLPTEYEWEKAASWDNVSKRRFPWGNNWDSSYLNNWESGPNRTTKVGSYPQGESYYGCSDMAGNVWEWCLDWFNDNYEQMFSAGLPKDPVNLRLHTARIDKGGGWYHDVGQPFTFLKAADDPGDVFHHCGFRIVQSGIAHGRGDDLFGNFYEKD